MRVLIVSSGNSGQIAPFVFEHVESLKRWGVEFEYYRILGKGIIGYLNNLKPLSRKIKSYQPDLIHAHYGLSGLLSLLTEGKYPLITTFHGNDINTLHPLNKLKPNWNKILSGIVHIYGNHSIFVSEAIAEQIKAKPSKSDIIPCQVNLDTFYPLDKDQARMQMNLLPIKRYILFSSSFNNPIKNYALAKQACFHFTNLELMELHGYARKEVNLLFNACDLALITSFNEGSSQFLKEAMACNCPVVSTDIGDVKKVFGNTDGCFITSYDPSHVSGKIQLALEYREKYKFTNGREKILELGLDSVTIAGKVYNVYKKVLKIVD